DRLELAYDRPRLGFRERLGLSGPQLDEALERRPGVRTEIDLPWIEDEPRVLLRLDERSRPAEHRNDLRRRLGRLGKLLVAHRRDRVDREPSQPAQVEADVVLWHAELVQVVPHRRRRKALLAELRDRRVAVPLRELLPVFAEHEAVMDHL